MSRYLTWALSVVLSLHVAATQVAAQMPWGEEDPNKGFDDTTGAPEKTDPPAGQNPNTGQNPFGGGQNPFGGGQNPFGGATGGGAGSLSGGAGKYQLGGIYAVGNPSKTESGVPQGAWGIKIESVEENGAGARAGLKPGDVIIGIGGQAIPDKENPIDFVEAAVIQAEEAKGGGAIEVQVHRSGKNETLKVKVAGLGKGSARRRAVGLYGLKYLAESQKSDGSWNVELRNHNSLVSTAALGGLAFIAGGNTPQKGPYAANLKKTMDYVMRMAGHEPSGGFGGMGGGGANNNQENWSIAYAVIFLGELYSVYPDNTIKPKVKELVDFLAQNQEQDGSWAHGPGGPNSLGYTTVQACGNLCLMAYGEAQRIGVAPSKESLKKGLDYLPTTSFGDGGIGYSHNPGQKGSTADSGKTATGVVAYNLLGISADPWYEKMVTFYRANLVNGNRALPEGHVTATMHILGGALCAWSLGRGDWQTYLSHYETYVMANRKLDGSFAMRPNHETAQGSGDTDLRMGPAWTTAHNAIILLLEDRQIPNLGGGKKGKDAAGGKDSGEEKPLTTTPGK